MGRNFHFLHWVLIAAFLLVLGGIVLSLTFIILEAGPWISLNLNRLPHYGTGGKSPEGISSPAFFATATRTPFQPLDPWTSTPPYTPTFTPTATSTVTETPLPPTPTDTPLPTDTPYPTDTPDPFQPPPVENAFPPEEASINSIEGHAQLYTLDCESRSAVDMAAYFGVFIDENEFLNRLPLSDDPNEGFVGNYWDPRGQIPPASYGVYAGPIAALLREYGLNAYAASGLSWETIRNEIAYGRPVMAWVINNTYPGAPVSYTPSNGNTTTVAHFQHTVLVIGYTPSYAVILDGDIVYWRTIDQFLDSWSVLGNMAVLIQ
jgi:uncharacterized protein YvpB